MIGVLILILSAECLLILVWALRERDRLIQYPFLAAAVFAGWMLPQIVGLSFYSQLPEGALEKTTLMAILSLGAIWIGYNWSQMPTRMLWWQFERSKLVWGSVILCVIGGYFAYRVSLLAASVTLATGGQWTGVITIYEFFSHLITVGMVIALLVHLKKPSWQTLWILLLCSAFYADRIIIKGRRAAMVEFTLVVVLGLWFQRRLLFPKWLMVATLFGAALVVNSIGEYRSVMLGSDRTSWSGASFTDIANIDFLGNFGRMFSGERGNAEVTNAAMSIEATDRLSDFNFGLSLWNGIVDKFVPGQLIGADTKQAMKVDLDDAAYVMFRHVPLTGSTATGLSEAFASFWYFGALEFLLIGLFMGRWYRAAVAGNIAAQVSVILLMTAALESITHSTEVFLSDVLVLGLFLLPVLLIARAMPRTQPMSAMIRAG